MAVFAGSYWTLILAFTITITGIAVGAGVPPRGPISQNKPPPERAKHVGAAQLALSFGPLIGFLLAVLVEPSGRLGSRLIFAQLFVVAFVTWYLLQGLPETEIWKESNTASTSTWPLHGARRLFRKKANITPIFFLIGVYLLWNIVAG